MGYHQLQNVLSEGTCEQVPEHEMITTPVNNQWNFGLKAHIGIDARTDLTHKSTTTTANDHDLNQAENLLHGEESFIFVDMGYRGAEKRDELIGLKLNGLLPSHPARSKS